MTASAEWQRACADGDVKPGDRLEVELGGRRVLLLGAASGIVACAADCPHQDTPLCDGDLDGDVLTCPIHFWQWQLPDGAPLGLAELPLPVHPVELRDGAVWVRLG
jgi:nitrite reductase/ring-hydroxylating ferredoxin subunit